MYSGDHGPPHFHVQSPGEWEVRVFFLQDPVLIQVKFQARRIPSATKRRIGQLARQHRAALIAQWERSVSDD